MIKLIRKLFPTKKQQLAIHIRQLNPYASMRWSEQWAEYFVSGGTFKEG